MLVMRNLDLFQFHSPLWLILWILLCLQTLFSFDPFFDQWNAFFDILFIIDWKCISHFFCYLCNCVNFFEEKNWKLFISKRRFSFENNFFKKHKFQFPKNEKRSIFTFLFFHRWFWKTFFTFHFLCYSEEKRTISNILQWTSKHVLYNTK